MGSLADGSPVQDAIELVQHNSEWREQFRAFASELHAVLPHVSIEHFGSTAVQGLIAKPVIDVMVIASSDAIFSKAKQVLEGCDFAEAPTLAGRAFFIRRNAEGVRTHHVHLRRSSDAQELVFRDVLRSQPSTRAEYEALKRKLASEHRLDRDAYVEGKTNFIAKALSRWRAIAPTEAGISFRPLAGYSHAIPVIAHWFFSEWEELYPPGTTVDDVANRIAAWATQGGVPHGLVAVEDGVVVGTVALRHREVASLDFGPWLAGLYVTAPHRNRGIGRVLVAEAERVAAQSDIATLHLITPNSRKFYESMGWTVMSEIVEHGSLLTVMKKTLRC